MLAAIIFDLDDTLIDWSYRVQDWPDYTYPHLIGTFNYVHSIYANIDLEDFLETVAGIRDDMWRRSKETLIAPHVGKLLTQSFNTLGVPGEYLDQEKLLLAYDWKPVAGEAPFQDALEILPLLREKGIVTAVLSNASETMWMRDAELREFGLLRYFPECRISSADVGFMKPHPLIFKAALSCLHSSINNTIMVGDNLETDILGAQKQGLRTVLRIGSQNLHRTSSPIRPDAVLKSLHELLPILDEWYLGWR